MVHENEIFGTAKGILSSRAEEARETVDMSKSSSALFPRFLL